MFRRPLALHSTLEIGLDGLNVRRLELADAKGRLQLSGTLDWSPHLAWNAAFTAADLNPDIVLEQLDGGLSGGLAAKGVYRDGKVTAELRQCSIGDYVLSDGELAAYSDRKSVV